jgi:hypothetical protein
VHRVIGDKATLVPGYGACYKTSTFNLKEMRLTTGCFVFSAASLFSIASLTMQA